MGEVVAVHPVTMFEVADHRFDGCSPFHLSLDGWRDPAFLACGEDVELVGKRCIVATITGISQNAVEGCTSEFFNIRDYRFQRMTIPRVKPEDRLRVFPAMSWHGPQTGRLLSALASWQSKP